MSLLPLLVLSALVLQAFAQGGWLRHTSVSSPDFYQGEPINFTCQFKGVTAENVNFFGIRTTPSDGAVNAFDIGCTVSRRTTTEVTAAVFDGEGPTNQECKEAFKNVENGEGMITISIKPKHVGNYQCVHWDTSKREYVAETPDLPVSEIKVAPTSLAMEITPKSVYIGDNVTIECKSEGGTPTAMFKYGVVDGSDYTTAPATFKAEKGDKGKSVWCRNTAHSNYKGGDNELTYKKQKLNVYYFLSTKPGITNMEFNPKSTELLQCPVDDNRPPGVNISYSWHKNGARLNETNPALRVSQDPLLNSTLIDEYKCTASTTDPKLTPITVIYNITWNVQATIPPEPTTTTTEKTKETKTTDSGKGAIIGEKSDATMIIIIVVVVVTVIILIVVIVIIVRRRRASAEVSKEAGQPTDKKSDPEQGNCESDANEPMLSPESEGRGGKTADEPEKQ